MSNVKNIITLLFSFVMISFYSIYAEDDSDKNSWNEVGVPLYHNFTSQEYGGHFQNWFITEDNRGFILVANNDGLLEYDGVSWRRYNLGGTPYQSLRSIAQDSSGIIYCGSNNHFGYLTIDKNGNYKFNSFLSKLDKKYRNFNDIWYTLIIDSTVFFVTHNYLFQWHDQKLTVAETTTSENIFHTAFVVNNKLFIRQSGIGLMQMQGEVLEKIPNGEIFANLPVYLMEPYDDNSILIGTDIGEFYLYDGKELSKFKTTAKKFLQKKYLYCGTKLNHGLYALGTRLGGLGIIDSNGNLLKVFDNTQGLQDNSVWNLHKDQQGNLWLALNNGITKVELPSPISIFTRKNGLEGTVEKIIRHKNIIYAATNQGIFYIDNLEDMNEWESPFFKRLSGVNEYCWNLYSEGDALIAGTTGGIYIINDNNIKKIHGSWGSVFEIIPSKYHKNIYFLSTRFGIGLLRQYNRNWINEGYIPNISEKIYHIVEEDSITLWTEIATEGVIRIKLLSGKQVPLSKQSIRVDRFTSKNGLPTDRVYPIHISEKIFFSTPQGMYRFNEKNNSFTKAENFKLGGTWGFLGTIDDSENLWISNYKNYGDHEKIYFGKQLQDGSFELEQNTLENFPDVVNVNTIYPENENVVWVGTSDGLIRYDKQMINVSDFNSKTHIRRVIVNSDSILNNGEIESNNPELNFSDNNLRFEYALTSYSREDKNKYQVLLEGYDKDWSNWSSENRKDYTNLPYGEYVFKVRGKDFLNKIGSEASFLFYISAPWYKTFWAYSIYTLFFIFFVVAIDRMQRKRLIQREQFKSKIKEGELTREKNIELNDKNTQLENTLISLKKIQKELQHSESRFRSVAQNANDAIITSNKTGCIIFWNKYAELLFGYHAEEVVGKPLTILMPERYKKDHSAGFQRFIEKNEARIIGKVVELIGVKKDGTEFPIELTISDWITEEGKFVTGIIRDITKRKEEQIAKEKAYSLLEKENQRKTEELEKARGLQLALLPKEIPQTDQFEIAAYMNTAVEVGGDYYDFYKSENCDLTTIIGDAAGHGLEAGMMVSATKSLVSSLVHEEVLTDIFNKTNRIFKNLNLRNMFMALQIVRFKNMQLEFCSAGMPPAIIYRHKKNTVEELSLNAMPLGVFQNFPYKSIKTKMNPGDCLMLMTDGFPERFNESNEMCGYGKPKSILMESHNLSSKEIIDYLIKTGDKWAGTAPQSDDITFIIIKAKQLLKP